jgi:putative transposase
LSHTFAKNHLHIIFSTKRRRKIIPEEIQPKLWSYIAGICHSEKIPPIAINGMDDHAHVLFHLPPSLSLAKAVSSIKANSSRWMNEHGLDFAWQEGYGAFGVSISTTAAVANYIRDQQRHHRKMSFEDEYRQILRRHGAAADDRK